MAPEEAPDLREWQPVMEELDSEPTEEERPWVSFHLKKRQDSIPTEILKYSDAFTEILYLTA